MSQPISSLTREVEILPLSRFLLRHSSLFYLFSYNILLGNNTFTLTTVLLVIIPVTQVNQG